MNQFLKGMVYRLRVSSTIRYPEAFTPAGDWKPEGETIALYSMDAGEGTVLKDLSGNGHDGHIVGASWVSDER